MMRLGWMAVGLLAVGYWGAMAQAGAQGSAATEASKPMAKEAHPGFEVAAIKRTPLNDNNQGINSSGNRMTLERQSVKSMMMFAYGVHGKQIVGQPAWVDDETYDVQGVLDRDGAPSVLQMQGALVKLLEERFGLKVHREKREMNYFALRVAGTPKMVKAAAPDDQPDQNGNGGAKGMTMTFSANTMDDFTLGMLYFTDRPVVNETGLAGRYDFVLKWMPDSMQTGDVPADAAPGLFTAVRDELGLELKPAKGPVEGLVVDAVARPSAN